MSAKVGSLNVDITLETARFKSGLKDASDSSKRAKSDISSTFKGIVGILAASGIAEAFANIAESIRSAVDAVGNLGEEAAALGVSTDGLQAFRFAATQVNLENKEMDQILAQLTRRTGDAAAGVKATAEAFAKLGIDVRDANGNVRSTEQLLPLIADRLKLIPTEAERAAIMVDLFGKSGQKAAALFAEGSEGLKAYADEARKLGIVLSSGEIAKADEVADKLAALNATTEARQNAQLVRHAESILLVDSAWAEFKLGLIEGVATFVQVTKRLDHFLGQIKLLPVQVTTSLAMMVAGVSKYITGQLNGLWDRAIAKIEQVEGTFAWLYDRVVGNSWIPDMVVEVGQHMDKLDALMVDPARRATASTSEAFRALASEVGGLLDRLFPEAARLKALREDLATIDAGEAAGLLSGSVAEGARFRRRQEEHGARDTGLRTRDPGPAIPTDVLEQQMRKFTDAMKGMGDRADVQTVRIAKSFQDMANDTLSALERMTGAIKGGGFLDILGAVLNFGLQLGSVGVFGKGVQTRVNTPALPSGSVPASLSQASPSLSLVNRSYSSPLLSAAAKGGGGAASVSRVEIVPSPYFNVVVDGRVQRYAPGIASAGAGMAADSMARSKKWRLG